MSGNSGSWWQLCEGYKYHIPGDRAKPSYEMKIQKKYLIQFFSALLNCCDLLFGVTL